ncbi:MAG TPA: hypothetical protein VK056_01745 [Bacillota bacterium]|nr:hypothetical protein [Bacillota bacterium]
MRIKDFLIFISLFMTGTIITIMLMKFILYLNSPTDKSEHPFAYIDNEIITENFMG